MATNVLLRQNSSNEQFVYRYTQPNSNLGSDSSIESLVNGVSGYNDSFVSSAGWRMLNLRLPSNLPSNYIGKLEFSMGTGGGTVLSAACGFTLGIPPLYATHINTITKSIAYGFICNPFNITNNQNRLWVVHENTLTQLGTQHTPSSVLSIEIKNGVATYQVGSTIVFTSAIQTSMPLYVVGVCGFNNNTITNIGLEGGSGFTVPSIDYSKEIWILCNGLTSQAQRFDGLALSGDYATGTASRLSRIELLTNAGKTYTITFPNESIENVNTITSSWRTITSQSFAALPIVIRIAFSSLTDLLGIKIVNPSTGTGTSIFNSTSIQNLNNLQELEIRSVDDLASPSVNAIRQFKPAIGQLPLPLQSLKTLFVEGCFDIPTTIANVPKCLNLETVIYFLANTNKPNFSALRNLKKFIFNPNVSPTNIRFSGFRELFNPTRAVTTHGLLTGNLSETQYLDLALAQISSSLLWQNEDVRIDSESYMPTSGVTGGYSFNGSTAAHVGDASSLQDGGNLPNSTLSLSGEVVTITIVNGAPNGNINNTIANHFQNGSPICFKKQTLQNQRFVNTHSNIQLRRISNYSGDTVSKTVSGSNLVISFKLIPIKTRSTFANVTITANTTYLTGTTTSFFTISNISTTNLLVGDTVRLSSSSISVPFASRTSTPSIIVEIIDANSVVISKGNVSDGIAAGTSSVVVNYEFPAENSTSPLTNPANYTTNQQNTIIRTNGSQVSIVALLAFFRNGVPGN